MIIKLPTWATYSTLQCTQEQINALNNASGLSLSIGDANPFWGRLVDIALGGGSFTRGDEYAFSSEITKTNDITIDEIKLICAIGGEVYGLNVYFIVDDLDVEIPVSFPNRISYNWDEDTQETISISHTWRTWYSNMPGHNPNDTPEGEEIQPVDGVYKCSSANTWNSGRPIDASCWAFTNLEVIK